MVTLLIFLRAPGQGVWHQYAWPEAPKKLPELPSRHRLYSSSLIGLGYQKLSTGDSVTFVISTAYITGCRGLQNRTLASWVILVIQTAQEA